MSMMSQLISHKHHPAHHSLLAGSHAGRLVKACLATLLLLFPLCAHAQWKAYLAYSDPTEIERASGNLIYVLASGDLYSYDTSDQSLQTYDKTTVLSDCGIAHIAWCQQARRMVICYND